MIDEVLTLKQAAKLTPYSADYLNLRARQGKLKAQKIGRDWLTTKEAVIAYMKQVKKSYKLKGDSIQ